MDVFDGVALVYAKESSGERGGNVEPVVDEEHEESFLERQLERVAGAHFTQPVLSGEPLLLVFVVVYVYLGVDCVEF